MGLRCEWLGHSWENDGDSGYSADLLTQPQTCRNCPESRAYVESWSVDEKPKLVRYAPRIMLGVGVLLLLINGW